MKTFLFAVLAMLALPVLAEEPLIDLDKHVQDEGRYWLNGTPNNHQRYVVNCGIYRVDGNPLVFPDDSKTVVSTRSNDLDYVVMMAVANLCGQIQTTITERIAELLADSATDPMTKAYIGIVNGNPEIRLPEDN